MKKIIFSLSIISLLLFSGCVVNNDKFYENFIKARDHNLNAVDYRTMGNDNYKIFYDYYQDNYFQEAIRFCSSAREYYVSANKEHDLANTYFKMANKTLVDKYEDLIEAYIDYGEITIKINWLNYEACEYYESASYSFIKGELEVGNLEVDKGNEKTVARDNLVEEMNRHAAKIKIFEI